MLLTRSLFNSSLVPRPNTGPVLVRAAQQARASGHLHVAAAAAVAAPPFHKSATSSSSVIAERQPRSLYDSLDTLAAYGTSRIQADKVLWPASTRLCPELRPLDLLNMLSHRGQMTLEGSLQLLEDYFIILQDFVAKIMPAECR